jgi:hypothetical protein
MSMSSTVDISQRKAQFFSSILGECQLEISNKGELQCHVPDFISDPYSSDRIVVSFEEERSWLPDNLKVWNPFCVEQKLIDKWDNTFYWSCQTCLLRYTTMISPAKCPACSGRRYFRFIAERRSVTRNYK